MSRRPASPTTRHSRLLLPLLSLVTVGVALLFGEAVSRQLGHQPGVLSDARIVVPPEVHLLKGLIADADGVMKFDPAMRQSIARLIREHADVTEIRRVFGVGYERSVLDLVESFAQTDPHLDYRNPFNRMISELARKDLQTLTPLERAYLSYAREPLNSEGFRSIEFEDFASGRSKVLLLGDSFTWGYSAKPLTSSFADTLAAAGFAVYNTGIPAVDPAQYEYLAAKYVPKLKPDVVIVSFTMANDIVWWERRLEPFQFYYYPTDAGFFWAEPKREYLRNPRQAFEYALQFHQIPDQSQKCFNWLCAQTVLGTKLWLALSQHAAISRHAAQFADYNQRNIGVESPQPVSEVHVRRIRELTEHFGGTFILAVIPDLPQSVPHGYTPADVFKQVPFHIPDLTLADYQSADSHFNNDGHRRYAEFLTRLIGR